jgi:hypothetical protein
MSHLELFEETVIMDRGNMTALRKLADNQFEN